MFKCDVLCIGSATIDNFLTVDQPLKSIHLGDKILVKSQEKHTGGGATNSAVALSKLGLKVKILTKLGNDHEAIFIEKELKKHKIKNICLHKSKKNTDHSTLISSTKERDRIILVNKGASFDLRFTDFKKSKLKTKWIYLATLMGTGIATSKQIAQYAQKKKINLLFNPSLYLAQKGTKVLAPILRATKILVLNKEEAQALIKSKTNSIKKLLFALKKLGPEIVIITNGAKHLYALNKDQIYSLLPSKIKVVHTAGAGDAFTSAFLAGIIKNHHFTEAMCLGQVNADSVIQHIGTKNKLLNEKEAKLMIKRYQTKIKKC